MTQIDLQILYEDNHLIAAVKPAGVLSQADGSAASDMLTLLKSYIKVKYEKPGAVWLGLVHRLDQPVSGVMIFARTSKAAARLSAQIRERQVGKHYLAVVSGDDVPAAGKCSDILVKDTSSGRVSLQDNLNIDHGGKISELDFSRLGTVEYRGRKLNLLEINLGSGRSHQIRVQLSVRGWPILGDWRYGPDDNWNKSLPIRRSIDDNGRQHADIALFCSHMEILHPVSKERLTITAKPPQEFPWNLF